MCEWGDLPYGGETVLDNAAQGLNVNGYCYVALLTDPNVTLVTLDMTVESRVLRAPNLEQVRHPRWSYRSRA